MAAVSIEQVSKAYGGQQVVHDVDLRVEDGEFCVLVGPSGCGKSTLLRMVAGLEDISAGSIRIGDRVVNEVAPKDRDIAMVFQNYALYPHMSVRENMGFSLRLAGRPKAEIAQRISEAAAILDLTPYLDRQPRQLSGGQRQRVAMGRAIVRKPQVFLFDEPLSNLDAKLRVQMRTEIRALHQRLGTTAIYVTHDQIEAMTMADRIVVLRDGRIEQVGAPLTLYDRPDNLFVAGFIGSPPMNLLPARLSGARLVLADGQQLNSPALVPAASEGIEVTVGIRPEHLSLLPHTADPDPGAGLRVPLVAVEPTGADTLLIGRLEGHHLTAAIRERPLLTPGATLGLHCEASRLHVFDAASGRRLNLS